MNSALPRQSDILMHSRVLIPNYYNNSSHEKTIKPVSSQMEFIETLSNQMKPSLSSQTGSKMSAESLLSSGTSDTLITSLSKYFDQIQVVQAITQSSIPTINVIEAFRQDDGSTSRPPTTTTPEETLTAVYVSDEVVVKFDPRVPDSLKTAYIKALETEFSREIEPLEITILKVPKGKVRQVSDEFNDLAVVQYAEPNYIATISETLPNDPSLNNQYGLNHLQAAQAWDLTTGSSSVTIAILDTGVDLDHPDLANKIIPGYDFVNNDDQPDDDHFHGTHVAGVAAASTNNGIGIAGISWGARIMPLKVLDNNGSGSYANVIAGIVWAVDHGARVINLSLGGTNPSPSLEAAVNYAYEHDVVIIAAAGNTGDNTINYPAAYAKAIAVAAIDTSSNRAAFSNYGSWVDLTAPGVAIYSTMPSDYGYLSGTSMASSYVSGAAALLAGLPQFTSVDLIRTALEATALDLGEAGLDPYYGFGLVQLSGALAFDHSQVTPLPTYTQTPLPAIYDIQTSEDIQDPFPINWVNANNDTGLHGDDGYAIINLPIIFHYNHQPRTKAFISTNGFLAFSSEGAASFNNVSIPNPNAPNDYIAPYWDDLNTTIAGGVYYDILGSEPNRSFIVEWREVPLYDGSGTVSFELIINEDSEDIYFLYGPLTGTNTRGNSATVGIEYSEGFAGAMYSINTIDSIHTGLIIRFSPISTNLPTPTITHNPTSTATPTPVPTATQTPAPTFTTSPTPTFTQTATNEPSPTPTPTFISTFSFTPSLSPTSTPVHNYTNTPTKFPYPSQSSTAIKTVTVTPTIVNENESWRNNFIQLFQWLLSRICYFYHESIKFFHNIS